jgi:rod shape determining protein RodA
MKGRVDWIFTGAVAMILTVGTIAILSAASPVPHYTQVLQRHFAALSIGVVLYLFAFTFNYQIFQDQAKAIYAMCATVMIAVLVIGQTHKGHRSWLHLPFFNFQPVELARIGMILVLANFLDRRARKIGEVSTIFLSLCIVGPIMALVLKQPDFASMLTFFPLLLGMLFCAGARIEQLLSLTAFGGVGILLPLFYTLLQIRSPNEGTLGHYLLQTSKFGLATLVALGLIVAVVAVAWRLCVMMRMQVKGVYFAVGALVLCFGFMTGVTVNRQLKGYQRNRFVAFLAPEADIKGAAYNVHQSQIAIGSGGFWGKGLFSGTQGQLGFLPERHTDFVFAVVGEEMGFAGAALLLAGYMMMLWRIVVAAKLARDRYGYLVCCGLGAMLSFHLLLNVGMCLGIMPVAGIPLPLVSYGGSSLVITLASLGIVANIYSRRYSFL